MRMFLVENFDSRSCTLQLQNGQTLHITADDIVATLGLPIGHIEIKKRMARALPELLKELRAIFERTTAYTTLKALTRKVSEVDAVNPWFKRHFALLVMSVLIDLMANGYVSRNYIDHLWDVENIANLNWCEMVINALVNSKLVWMKNTDKIYGGPFLFFVTDCAKKLHSLQDLNIQAAL
nr:uncharacterized protein LOC109191529 [Ipomoea trifida]